MKESEKKFKQFQDTSKNIIKGVASVVGVITAAGTAIYGLTAAVAKNADEIAKTAKDIGISGESLQEFRSGSAVSVSAVSGVALPGHFREVVFRAPDL